jgi:hypothetical protein
MIILSLALEFVLSASGTSTAADNYGFYVGLIKNEFNQRVLEKCPDDGAPDGGSVCRIRIICMGNVSLSDADRLNGVLQEKVGVVRLTRFENSEWFTLKYRTYFMHYKSGWQSASESYGRPPDNKEACQDR